MRKERVAAYFDGFNLYHAIADLNKPHLKWVDLRRLSRHLIKPKSQTLVAVRYFSAYANHYSGTPQVGRLQRHREYVSALEAKGIDCHMGNFAERFWKYSGRGYQAKWRRREEKQTDVGIAVHVVRDAFRDVFDRALIISLDTDMLPIFRLMSHEFPGKPAICVAPPKRSHHRTLQQAAFGIANIKESQIERSLFAARVRKAGVVVARRPAEYAPPY